MKKICVFIDRDGVINYDPGHFCRIEELKILPGVAQAINLLNRSGIAAVVVTNQSAVAKGLITEAGVVDIHDRIKVFLAKGGATIDKFYYCPHHPEGKLLKYRVVCNCRKPSTGLFERAARELNVDIKRSFIVGDSFREIEAAKNLGCKSIAVECGSSEFRESTPDYFTKDLYEAVELIITQLKPNISIKPMFKKTAKKSLAQKTL